MSWSISCVQTLIREILFNACVPNIYTTAIRNWTDLAPTLYEAACWAVVINTKNVFLDFFLLQTEKPIGE